MVVGEVMNLPKIKANFEVFPSFIRCSWSVIFRISTYFLIICVYEATSKLNFLQSKVLFYN